MDLQIHQIKKNKRKVQIEDGHGRKKCCYRKDKNWARDFEQTYHFIKTRI